MVVCHLSDSPYRLLLVRTIIIFMYGLKVNPFPAKNHK
nr:MAG TPA: hypothetical protein [Caudoviricetes sp.]